MFGQELFISSVFVAGLLSFFAPCVFPLMPVYIGVIVGERNPKYQIGSGKWSVNLISVFRTLLFVGGLSTSFIILGFGAGALGAFINAAWFLQVSGGLVILLGLHHMGLFHLNFLNREKKLNLKRSQKQDLWGTYLLGFTFSFGWTPCVGPVLGAIIGVAAGGGQALYGGFLMLIYALGLLIPFLILGIFSDLLLAKLDGLNRHIGLIKKIGGVLIIIMGLIMMTGNLTEITVFFENIL